METPVSLLAEAKALLTGGDGAELSALKIFRQAAMLAMSERDYDTAENAARAAMACLTMLPDSTAGGRGVATGLVWSAAQIDALLNQIRAARRADNDCTVKRQPIQYVTERQRLGGEVFA